MSTSMRGTLLIISIFMTCGSMSEGFSTFKRQKAFSKKIVKPDSSNIGFDPHLVCRWQMFLASQVNMQRQYWLLSGCSGLLAWLECFWPGLVPRLHGGQALWWLPWWDMLQGNQEQSVKICFINLFLFSAKEGEEEENWNNLPRWNKVGTNCGWSIFIQICFRYVKSVDVVKKSACAKEATCKNTRKYWGVIQRDTKCDPSDAKCDKCDTQYEKCDKKWYKVI